jgi:hypothetical protein
LGLQVYTVMSSSCLPYFLRCIFVIFVLQYVMCLFTLATFNLSFHHYLKQFDWDASCCIFFTIFELRVCWAYFTLWVYGFCQICFGHYFFWYFLLLPLSHYFCVSNIFIYFLYFILNAFSYILGSQVSFFPECLSSCWFIQCSFHLYSTLLLSRNLIWVIILSFKFVCYGKISSSSWERSMLSIPN